MLGRLLAFFFLGALVPGAEAAGAVGVGGGRARPALRLTPSSIAYSSRRAYQFSKMGCAATKESKESPAPLVGAVVLEQRSAEQERLTKENATLKGNCLTGKTIHT